MSSTRPISAGIKPFPQPPNINNFGQLASYLNDVGDWTVRAVDGLNRQAKIIPYAAFHDMPPLDGPPRFVAVPDDPTYGQVICFNGVSTSGTGTGWYRLIPAGTVGAPSATIPAGGTASQVLGKASGTDYDFSWQTPHYLTTGGTAGQALRKTSGSDYAAAWSDVHEVPAGGTTSQVLAKSGTADYATAWTTIYPLPTGGTAGQALVKNTTAIGDASWSNTLGTTTVAGLLSTGTISGAGNISVDGVAAFGGTASYAQFNSTAAYLGKALQLANQTTAGTATAGTASALPATPQGYLQTQLNGTNVLVAFYKP